MNSIMKHPFAKSVSVNERYGRLLETVSPDDTLGIIINADPDAMASSMALKRLFWRKVKKAFVYHINTIQRADNLSLIRLLKIEQQHIRYMKPSLISKWAILDSQPDHSEDFKGRCFDIIIDHHPVQESSRAAFVDIRENFGALSTVMTEYLRAAKIKPSPRLATALFYGIKTDTDNFVRGSLSNDMDAFRYLYTFTNMNIIKKIESSEMTTNTLASYRLAMERLEIVKETAIVHMGGIDNPDSLVIIADFFMRLAEATWSFASGVYNGKIIVIIRNAGFRGDAGRAAERLFGHLGTAGGHKSAARAEIPIENMPPKAVGDIKGYLLKTIRSFKK